MDQDVVLLVKKLVIKNIPERLPNQDVEKYEATILRYMVNILGSKMTPVHVQLNDQRFISEMVKKKLTRENRLQDAIQFSELYNRLNHQRAITKPGHLVYMLHKIGSDRSGSLEDGSLALSALNMSQLSLTQTEQPPFSQSVPNRSTVQSSGLQNNMDIDPSHLHEAYQTFKNYENTTFEVDESDLLRDVIFAFQGIDGKYVHYDSLIDGFVVDSKVGVPRATRDLIRKLCELGWLFKKLKTFVESSSLQATNGLIVQSFSSAIETELVEYYKLIAMLEGQTHNKSVTLRQLMVWTLEPMEKLKTMAILVDAAKLQKGGMLLCTIQAYVKHGDPFIQTFVKKLMKSASVPFFNMMKAWVFEGELEDPFQEFLLEANPEVPAEAMWFKKYSLKQDMIPSFTSLEFSSKILKIGKTINFIRHCCNDSEFAIDSNTVALASQSFLYDNTEQLEVVINKIATIANQRLMSLIFQKYKLLLHCTALKKYLLLGQGDFTQHLLDLLQPDLEKPSHNVFRHNLLAILESAIRGSNAQYDDKDVLERLDVRMISKTSSSSWDIFCLDYKMSAPLNTIFTQETMITYTKIFQFLWTIKRVESSLDSTWKRHMHLAKILQQAIRTLPASASLNKLVTILHLCNIIRHNMVLFIGNIQYYLMFEVLECCWQELSQSLTMLQKDGDLDQLIQAHHKYLLQIIDQALLSKNQKDLKTQLEKVLHFVVEYIRTQDFVAMTAEDMIQKQKLKNDRLIQQAEDEMNDDNDYDNNKNKTGYRRNLRESSPTSNAFPLDESTDQGQLEQCLTKVQNIRRQYEQQSAIFLKMLERQQSNNALEYLQYRLQYSANHHDQ